MFATIVAAGCSNEGDPAPAPVTGRAGNAMAQHEKRATGGRDTLRVKADTARGRLWVVGLDDVRVYDALTKQLIRQVTLPNWSVSRFTCQPDLALDKSGSAIISSNVQAKLWRIDADSFEAKEHAITLQGRERWDVGFGALAFAADGTLYALTSTVGSLWKIDVAKASAGMIEPNNPPSRDCAFTPQFMKDFERSPMPWTRPLPQQN